MEKLPKRLRRIAMAVFIAASASVCSADVVRAQIDASKAENQQLQKLMEDFVKRIPDAPQDQSPSEHSTDLQNLFKALTKDMIPKGEQAMPQACLLPLLLPSSFDQKISAEEQEKANQLQQKFSDLVELMVTKQWDEVIELTQKALDLEKGIITWPLGGTREQYRGEMWSNRGAAYLARIQGDRTENIERAIEALKKALEAYHEGLKSSAVGRECSFMVANINVNLGSAYGQRIRGEKAENLEFAIAAFEEALTTLTPETTPQLWGGRKIIWAAPIFPESGGSVRRT